MANKGTPNDLKSMAAAAKERLVKGYWTAIKKERAAALERVKKAGKDPQLVIAYFSERCTRDIAAMSNSVDRREEEMYKKVKSALENGVEIVNPVSVLMDKEYMQALTDAERQRYILSLMGKYAELKERYVREQNLLSQIEA